MSKTLPVSIVIFLKDIDTQGAKLWMQVRREDGPLDGLLEFPGGKIELGENSEMAARREVFEEVDYTIPDQGKVPLFLIHPYDYSDRSICLYVHIAKGDELPAEKGRWIELDYKKKSIICEGTIPAVNHIIIDKLLGHIEIQYNAGTWEQI
jgi:8-oxo-dGTP diphosphatase